jgi:23S rRNA (guanosine2251-2'-O)-methyltransferase
MNKKLKLDELNRLTVEEFKETEKIPVALVLDNIRSLHNIGSIFRSADCFAIAHVFLCGITATPPHREINKTALGATDSVDWSYFESTEDLIKQLKTDGWLICSVEQAQNSVSMLNLSLNRQKKYCFILGNEVDGVNQEVINLSDYIIELEQFGTKHSINVSVCAGIILWEARKKLTLPCN